MKLGTQSVNTHGPTTFASGTPTVLPTNPNSPFAKLVAKNEVGQIIQQWLLLQNKCTLGSASSCALRCQLAGIAPYHALLVMGARQVFIRALAPKLSRNGVMVNELLLTEDQCTFEIAGHQFELIRNLKTNEPASSDKPSQNKMKFTLARPMEIGQVRQPTVIPAQVPPQAVAPTPAVKSISTQAQAIEPNQASFERLQSKADASEVQPQWITDLIQSAMLPLERQLSEIIEPLAAVQNELDKRSKLDRKRRNRTPKRRASDRVSQDASEFDNNLHRISSERIAAEQIAREQIEREREQLAREREQIERDRNALGAAFTTQIDVQQQISDIPEPLIVPIVSPEVEAQLARQSEALGNLNARLTEVKSNLGSLERIVSENFVTVIGAATSPTKTPEPVSEALNRITSVTDELKTSVAVQLKGLTNQLDEVRNNLGSLQQTVTENLASTNELRSAPEPASQEALQQLTDVANQLGLLLQEMNARQISAQQTALQSDVALREQLRTQEDSELASREQLREQLRSQEDSDLAWREQLKAQIGELRDTIAATESSILSTTQASIAKSIEKVTQTTQAEILAATEAAILKASELRNAAPQEALPNSATLAPLQSFQAPAAIAVAAPVITAPINTVPVNTVPVSTVPATATPVEASSEFATGFATEESVAVDSESQAFVANVAEEIVESIQPPASMVADEPELPLNQFSQYSWNPEPTENSGYAFTIEQNKVVEPVPFESAWDAPATPVPTPAIDYSGSSANFIEEPIEDAPMVEEALSALPSWWTEDDKTQFKDDSSASAALSSAWNISKFTEPTATDPSSSSTGGVSDYSEGFADPSENSGYQSASAWDVEVKYDNSSVEIQAPASSIEPEVAKIDDIAPFESLPASSENQAAPSVDESYELSSLLERFGIAREPSREPIANEAIEQRTDRKPIAKRENYELGEELPARNASAFASPQPLNDAVEIDQTEVVRALPESIAIAEPESVPTPAEPTPTVSSQPAVEESSSASAESGEEESIEDYMKRLMARMRGGSIEEEPRPTPAPVVNVAPAPIQSLDISSSKIPLPGAATERAPSSTTGPFDPEEYVPKALAPEKTRNMAAMRELANNSARSAIQVSARRRYGTAIAMKLAIALIGLGVGITLVMINGLNVNIGLIATVASFLVALIWGIDAFSTLKPLLYAAVESLETVPPPAPEADEAAQV